MVRTKKNDSSPVRLSELPKCPSGIPGLDQITGGGLPRGRPTLVCGGAGSGKTLLAMEFLVKGAAEYGEPGVFMSFEENADELVQNVASLGFDVGSLVAGGMLVIDHVQVERNEIEETGEYDLEGLFIRLGYAIDSVGAKRVVLDTIEALFAALPTEAILRAELRRLFRWLKDKGVTAVITGERGNGTFTRHGLEEYVSDCVILLDQRVADEVATRRLRIVKYRGTTHGTNEYPFLIDEQGFTVVPITAVSLQYAASDRIVSTGVPALDAMLGGKGYYRGGSLLVSGTAGTGKTSLAAQFIDAACKRGERALYFAFEESPEQFMRNMRSIGIDLRQWVDKGLLRFHAARPDTCGLEMHLATMQRMADEFRPEVAVFDPMSSLKAAASFQESRTLLMRLVDFLKARQITALFTSLTGGDGLVEQSEVGISSLIDTWLFVRNLEQGGERTRMLSVLKARGMAHSNRVREFILTEHGVDLVDVYVGSNGILTGSARAIQEMQDEMAELVRHQDGERKRLLIERKRQALTARIAELQAEFEADVRDMEVAISEADLVANKWFASRAEAAQRPAAPAMAEQGDNK